MKKNWESKLEEVLESHDGTFGHNTEVDIKRYLRRVEKLGSIGGRTDCCLVKIDVLDYYTVKISLPDNYQDGSLYRENILLHILTTSPMPTECRYNKKKDSIIVEWHY